MSCTPQYLYTVYRNIDDKMILLDVTAEECCRIMKIKRDSFYKLAQTGGNKTWSVLKSTKKQIAADVKEWRGRDG